MANSVTEQLETTEQMVRNWDAGNTTAPPIPPRHPARLSLQIPSPALRPPPPQRHPTRATLADLQALEIARPSSPYASSSVYDSEPSTPVTQVSDDFFSSNTSEVSGTSSKRSSLSRRLPAKTIVEIRAKIEDLRPRLEEFRSKVDEFKSKTDSVFLAGRDKIRTLRNCEEFRWQELC